MRGFTRRISRRAHRREHCTRCHGLPEGGINIFQVREVMYPPLRRQQHQHIPASGQGADEDHNTGHWRNDRHAFSHENINPFMHPRHSPGFKPERASIPIPRSGSLHRNNRVLRPQGIDEEQRQNGKPMVFTQFEDHISVTTL